MCNFEVKKSKGYDWARWIEGGEPSHTPLGPYGRLPLKKYRAPYYEVNLEEYTIAFEISKEKAIKDMEQFVAEAQSALQALKELP